MAVGIMLGAGSSGLMDVFLDAENRLVLYCLANKNPRIDEETLAKGTKLSADRVRQILSKLSAERLVIFEPEYGYTLTEKGLVSLHNFHKTIN